MAKNMSVFEGVMNLFDSLITSTDFEEIIFNLPDRSVDLLIILDILSDLRNLLSKEKSDSKKNILKDLIEIYDEIKDKMVYVPFDAFRRKFVEHLETIVEYSAKKGKKFVLVIPSESLNFSRGIKSNSLCTGFAISYLTLKKKQRVISGIIFQGSSEFFESSYENGVCIFRNNKKGFLPLDKKTISENTTKDTLFIYCDDGLYSGSQFETCARSCLRHGISLVPVIPYMRENYVPAWKFPDEQYQLKYEKFPLATKMNASGVCSDGGRNVLGYFQHKIPDSLSIGLCIPFLDKLKSYTGYSFNGYSTIIKNTEPNMDLEHQAEYKSMKYFDGTIFDKIKKTFLKREENFQLDHEGYIENFQFVNFQILLRDWITSSEGMKNHMMNFPENTKDEEDPENKEEISTLPREKFLEILTQIKDEKGFEEVNARLKRFLRGVEKDLIPTEKIEKIKQTISADEKLSETMYNDLTSLWTEKHRLETLLLENSKKSDDLFREYSECMERIHKNQKEIKFAFTLTKNDKKVIEELLMRKYKPINNLSFSLKYMKLEEEDKKSIREYIQRIKAELEKDTETILNEVSKFSHTILNEYVEKDISIIEEFLNAQK